MINAGELKHRVTFQVATTTQNGLGAIEAEWDDAFACWGDLKPSTPSERKLNETWAVTMSHTLKVYHRTDINKLMRFTCRGRTYQIHDAVDPDGERTDLIVYASEVR